MIGHLVSDLREVQALLLSVEAGRAILPALIRWRAPGPMEIAVILVVALVIFGPKRLPELGKSLGGGMRSFKESVIGEDDAEEPVLPRKS